MPLDISTRRVTPRIGIFPHTIICRSWGAGDRSRWVGGALAGALLRCKIGGFPEFAARDYGRESGNPGSLALKARSGTRPRYRFGKRASQPRRNPDDLPDRRAAPRPVPAAVRPDRRTARGAGRAAGDGGFADRLSLPRLARGCRGPARSWCCSTTSRTTSTARFAPLTASLSARTRRRARATPTRRREYLERRTLGLRGFAADGMLKGGLLAHARRGGREDPRAARPSGDRHHPRAQCGPWLLPGAHREELNMATLATDFRRDTSAAVNDSRSISDETAWAAVMARDRTLDGRFVTGVLTTGIYCRPSCAARHPKRENVRFFATGAEARAAGLRPCLRCRPDEVTREAAALERVLRLLGQAEETPSLEDLAAAAGYSPHHFHRLFKRATGVTPCSLLSPPARPARRGGAGRKWPDHRCDLRCRLFRSGALLCRRQGPARHDALGLARRRPRRDDPLGDRARPISAPCWSRRRRGASVACPSTRARPSCAIASPTRRSSMAERRSTRSLPRRSPR